MSEPKRIVKVTFNDVIRLADQFREDVLKAVSFPQFVIGYDLGEHDGYRIIQGYGGVNEDDEERFSPKNFHLLIPVGCIIKMEDLG